MIGMTVVPQDQKAHLNDLLSKLVMMLHSRLQSLGRRRTLVFAVLSVLAIVSFLAVSKLVKRYSEQERALARHMYAQGQADQQTGRPDLALEDYRAALLYDRDNSQYQLSLARALRDSGRTEEAETYLLKLWEANPQDGAVNLALGRLYARRGSIENALHYYHNAIYGTWPGNADKVRNDAEFELVEFLLKANAAPQAQAELISFAAARPADTAIQLRIANLFMQAQDYEHALVRLREVLSQDPRNALAAAGAGEAAFALGRYRHAESYLRIASILNPQDEQIRELLQTTGMMLESDPFMRGISDAERTRRIRAAYTQAGSRLDSCAKQQGIDLQQASASPAPASDLVSLHNRWIDIKPKMKNPAVAAVEEENGNSVISLVGSIEQETATLCGPPTGMDKVLLLISQEPASSDTGADK